MIFDNCRIPDSYRLGMGRVLNNHSKCWTVAEFPLPLGVGIAKGAYEAAVKYSKERHQFDKPFLPSRAFPSNQRIWQPKLWQQNFTPRQPTGK
jgi:alkylation response protein AidB-like acyl-CoA dehydrogenase